MDELLSTLAGSIMFSTIGLESAYHQLPLHPDSRDLTAFITHEGLFRFCRVPCGLASAPSAFQKMMSVVLQGVPNVNNYLDDIYALDTPKRCKTLNFKKCYSGLQMQVCISMIKSASSDSPVCAFSVI